MSATPGRTCSATASCARSLKTTRWCRTWWTRAGSHPHRSLLTRVLDGSDNVDLDLSVREVRRGDRYLLCTDGLSGVVSPQTMAEALRLPDPKSAVDRLVELVLRGGAPDNVTCIVADMVDSGDLDGGDLDGGDPVVAGAAAADQPQGEPAAPDSAAVRAAQASRRDPAAGLG